jgi:hypothetical protein
MSGMIICTHSNSRWTVLRRVLFYMISSQLTASNIPAFAAPIRKTNPLKCQCWLLLTKFNVYQHSLHIPSLQWDYTFFKRPTFAHTVHLQIQFRNSSHVSEAAATTITNYKHQYIYKAYENMIKVQQWYCIISVSTAVLKGCKKQHNNVHVVNIIICLVCCTVVISH